MNVRDTWRLCHPVNINVYKNGVEGQAPTLVHIPAESKRNMDTVLEAIQARIKLPAGFPTALYKMDGTLVCYSYQLEMYQDYVVLSNVDRHFKCSCYGLRGPLVVVGHESKHIRSIRRLNKNYIGVYGRGKDLDKKQKYGYASSFISDGFGPNDLPYINNSSKECGVLCQKAATCRRLSEQFEQPKNLSRKFSEQCQQPKNSRQVTPESFPCARGDEDNDSFYGRYLEESLLMNFPPSQPTIQKDIACECKPPSPPPSKAPVEMLHKELNTEDMNCDAPESEKQLGSPVDSEHLIEFINRYRDIGGDIYRLFNDRISQDPTTGKFRKRTRSSASRSVDTRDSRLGDDLYRFFVDRLKNHSMCEDTGFSMFDSDSGSWKEQSLSKISRELHLLSLTDLKEMTDDGTGNSSAPMDEERANEHLERLTRSTEEESIEMSVISGETYEYTHDKIGTTNPHSNSRNNTTNIFTMQIQEQKHPFKLENGKLVVSNSNESCNRIENHRRPKGDYPSSKLHSRNHPFGDEFQSSDDDDLKKPSDVKKTIRRDFQTSHGDNVYQNPHRKTKTRNFCVQIGQPTTENMDTPPLSWINHLDTLTRNTNNCWQSHLASFNNTTPFGRPMHFQNVARPRQPFIPMNSSLNMIQRRPTPLTTSTPQHAMAPVFDSNGNVMYYILSYPNGN